jgi:type I restriction enzyme R subunit
VKPFPSPEELWSRYRDACALGPETAQKLAVPGRPDPAKRLRYYQEIAINRALQAILTGNRRLLLTICTGAGKTQIAFQLCWRLTEARWNRHDTPRKPKILYLADLNVLVDDPMAKDFEPFKDARHKIQGQAIFSRDVYFAIYQAIARDESRPGLYREYPRDFFDLVIVDECHRGSARDESNWREILEWFEPATQLGLTATPRHAADGSSYSYFGEPLYEYSLRQGIEDGFLAPYRVHRIVTDYDAAGWRPSPGEMDRYGREIPDELYGTPDFERAVALRARTTAIARHLTKHLKATDRLAKTMIFCVDQEHALEVRHTLINANADLVAKHPNYVVRITSDEKDVGAGHLGRLCDIDTIEPVIATTSKLLSTGVDAPTVKNIALIRMVGSMAEFKQIIGRGTRLRPDYGKFSFNILDYTGTAAEKFADPDFDGDPVVVEDIEVGPDGEERSRKATEDHVADDEAAVADEQEITGAAEILGDDTADRRHRKFYVDEGEASVVHEAVYGIGPDGRPLTVEQIRDHAANAVRTLHTSADDLRETWRQREQREALLAALDDRGVDLDQLGDALRLKDADPYDILCHVAYRSPPHTRKERAQRLKDRQEQLLADYAPEAREVLAMLIDKYADHGPSQLELPAGLEVPPIRDLGNPSEIARRFGGAAALRKAVDDITAALYAN